MNKKQTRKWAYLALLSLTVMGGGASVFASETLALVDGDIGQLVIKTQQETEVEEEVVVDLATNMVSEVSITYTANTYPIGQCTWGAKEVAPWVGNYWGNGGDWATSAAAAGFEVGTIPKVGAVMVFTDGGYGHVAVVTEVAETGEIQVLESNYAGNMTVGNYRGWFNPAGEAATIRYIYAPA